MNEVKHSQQDGLYVKVTIYDIGVNALIDTGSSITVLNPQKYYAISDSLRPPLQSGGGQLRMADGGLVTPLGIAEFRIEINGKSLTHQFIIADVEAPLVLGYDFLYRHNCQINMREGQLVIDGKCLPCQRESQMQSVFKITLSEDIIVPSNSEILVTGLIEGEIVGCEEAVVEPYKSHLAHNGILVAKAVVNPSYGCIPLRMVNLSRSSIKLYKHSCAAICEPVASTFHLEVTENDYLVGKVNKITTDTTTCPQEPEHLKTLIEESRKTLSEHQQDHLRKLLCKYESVFAKSKSDLELSLYLILPLWTLFRMVVQCTECGVSCANWQLLHRHYRYHHGDKIRCEYCTYIVAKNTLYRMRAHYAAKHPGRACPYGRKEHERVLSVRPCVKTVSSSPRFKKTPRSYSEETPVGTPDHPLSPLTPLKSPTPIYLEDFPSTPEREAMVSPSMRNLFTSPQRPQIKTASASEPALTVTSKNGEKSMHQQAQTVRASIPDSPYEPCLGSSSLEVPPYHPTPLEMVHSHSSPQRKVEFLCPAPTYMIRPIQLETSTQGTLYEYMNRVPSLHYADPREAFMGAPSLYAKTPQAECLRRIRMKSKMFGQLSNVNQFSPAPEVWLKRVEKAVLPDGTIYELSSMWFPDPTFIRRESKNTMTDNTKPIARHMETQTKESSLSSTLSAKSTEEKETQCSIFSLNLS
ncbi:hypothetical protein ACJMK2_023403 [Sinanodonta woodiana]|uniref:C2H2-type domain-containing protein n=1 Tax=Sinanodonta woodiana TaxID=1069815 RepID=A0ABD3T441_SINWO